jgi:hypothetical protein
MGMPPSGSLYSGFFDPKTQTLLGMAAGLLQAGGPQPYPNQLGPALGKGLMAGVQAGREARQSNLQQGLMAEQLKRAVEQGKMLDQLQKYYAGQQPPSSGFAGPQGPMQPAQAALAMGAQGGSVGPTNQNAALMNQMQPDGQPAAPQAPQAPQQQTPDYFNPQNLFYEGRLAQLAGLQGGDAMMNMALTHDPNVAGRVAGAQEAAKFPYAAGVSVLRNVGRPTVLGPGQTAQSNFPLLPPFLQNLITGIGTNTGNTLGTQPSAPSASPHATSLSGPSPLVVESGKAHAGEMEKQYGVWQNKANSAQQDNLLIDRMKAESQGFSPGKMAERYGNLQSYLVRLPGMDTPERKTMLADFQSFQKNATQLSTSAARTMGAREPGSVIAMFKNAYPNADLTQNTLNASPLQTHGVSLRRTRRPERSKASKPSGTRLQIRCSSSCSVCRLKCASSSSRRCLRASVSPSG